MINTANLVGSVSRNAGGLNESVRRLVQSVRDTGVGVRVLTVEDEFTRADLPAWHPVQVDVFRRSWPMAFGYSPGFLRVLDEYHPDLMHTHGIWMYPSIATTVFCHRHLLPYMISPHGMLDPWAVKHHRWKKVLAYAIYESDHVRGARCIRALCEAEARAIRQMGITNPVAIIPNGIDLPEVGGHGENAEKLKAEMLKGESGERGAEDRGQRSEARGQGGNAEMLKAPSGNAPWHGIIEPGKKVLLFLSRIHPKKGLPNLLRAWAHTSEERGARSEEWVLAIAGWDQEGHEKELKQLATELGIAWADGRERGAGSGEQGAGSRDQKSEVRGQKSENTQHSTLNSQRPPSLLFLGPQFNEAKAACYRECDAFILPSFSEGLPMVVLEAWAHGKPVLMTPECNLPEGFAANAALRIQTDVENIRQGLRQLFQTPDSELQTLGHKGRQLVAGKFTWTAIAAQLKATYEWMLGSTDKPVWMYQR